MRKSLDARPWIIGLCAVLLAVPVWADVETGRPYASGWITSSGIVVEGIGPKAVSPSGSATAGDIERFAALMDAARKVGEMVSAIEAASQEEITRDHSQATGVHMDVSS